MIKKITVAICDICGNIKEAKPVGSQHNETIYEIPDNWVRSQANKEVHICNVCSRKINMGVTR